MSTNNQSKPSNQPGIGVDSRGGAVIDPTANVLQLVQAAITRQDDLRVNDKVWRDKIDDLRDSHQKELRIAEKERIDAIRAVDVGAVVTANTAAENRASTLAKQVADSAETLRNQVAAAASASEVALRAALEPVQKDIAELRKVQYETAGGKAQGVETREVSGDRTALTVSVVFGVIGVVTAIIVIILRATGK